MCIAMGESWAIYPYMHTDDVCLGLELVGAREWAERTEGKLNKPANVVGFIHILVEILTNAAQAKSGFAKGGHPNMKVLKTILPEGTRMLETNVKGEYANKLSACGREAINGFLGDKKLDPATAEAAASRPPASATVTTRELSLDPRICADYYAKKAEPWDGERIATALLVEGGGTKGVAYGSVVAGLEGAGLMSYFKKFAGTSAGSQTAALLAFGYTGAELDDILKNAPWKNLLDSDFGCCRDMYRLWSKFGYYKGEVLEDYLDAAFAKKMDGKKMCTFKEHYAKHGKELRIGATNISTGEFEFLDRTNHPDMPIALACKASSAVPLVFQCVKWNGDIYVDGGVLGNLPTKAYPEDSCLGLELVGANEWAERQHGGVIYRPKSVSDFISALVGTLMNAAQAEDGFTSGGHKNMKVLKIILPPNTKMLETNVAGKYADDLGKAGKEAIEYFLRGQKLASS